jgi:uncharacterized membrane protein YtjA (UPF0391 family)
LSFLIIAWVAGAFGLRGCGIAVGIARVLFGIFIVLFLVGLVLGLRVVFVTWLFDSRTPVSLAGPFALEI